MMQKIKTFEDFINENQAINEEDIKPLEAKLPPSVIYNAKSKGIKKGTFYVDISDDSVKIGYDPNDKKKAYLEFTKEKVEKDGKPGVAVVTAKKIKGEDIENVNEAPVLDPKNKAGLLLQDFYSYCGQFGDDANSGFIPALSNILRILSVGEEYSGKTTPSFKSFMTGVYANFNTGNLFAGAEVFAKSKQMGEKFKNEMEKSNKRYPKKA